MTSYATRDDAIRGATSVARDLAAGKLAPETLEQKVVSELRELFGAVVGPGDPLWDLHRDVARQAVSLGALGPEELREWAVVLDGASDALRQSQVAPKPVSLPSVALIPEAADPEAEPDVDTYTEPDVEPAPVAQLSPEPQRRPGEYDPFRGWPAAKRGFLS